MLRKDLLLMLDTALVYLRYRGVTWLQEDRLREAEAARLAGLARQASSTPPRLTSQPLQELAACTAS